MAPLKGLAAAFFLVITPITAQLNVFGTGYIHVLNSTNWTTATGADSVGCLNAAGRFVLDDCAVFTHFDAMPYGLSTSAGICTFYDTSMPANTASPYGAFTYALTCQTPESAQATYFYTIGGFKLPFLCQGDIQCFVDAGGIPTAPENDAFNLWPYQGPVPQGHLQVPMSFMADAVSLTLRVFAMYGLNKWILACLLGVTASIAILGLFGVIEHMKNPILLAEAGLSGCDTAYFTRSAAALPAEAWEATLFCDTFVFGLIARRVLIQRKTSPLYAGSLIERMATDGTMYYGCQGVSTGKCRDTG
ncbi:hypothetical protein C8R45DRAFT_1138892 [Mycena sanguinolenta]|nr:hypothetical protein C8R45DRAFT_1138892 [Mycena sanguinolenta]